MNRKRMVCLLAVLVLLQACGSGSSSQAQPDIKMYYAIALTGGFAEQGTNACNGAKFAADSINQQGGIAKGPHQGAKLVIECIDNQQSPEASATIASKYVADPSVWTMMGFYSGAEAQAAAIVAARANLSIIGSNVSTEYLTQTVHNVLLMIPRIRAFGYAWVDFCKSYYGATKIADLSPDFSYMASYRQGRDDALHGGVPGVSLVSEQTYNDPGTQDFSPFISKIEASGAQCLLLGSYPPEQCKIAAQARQLGLTIPIIDFEGAGTSNSCIQAGGKAYVGLAFGEYIPFPPPPGSTYAKVAAAFQAKYNAPMGSYPAYSYDSVLAVKCALEDGAKTREDLLQYLGKVDCPGVTGQLKFQGLRPLERTLTVLEATGDTLDAREPVATYDLLVDGTARLVKLLATCADRPTCKFMIS